MKRFIFAFLLSLAPALAGAVDFGNDGGGSSTQGGVLSGGNPNSVLFLNSSSKFNTSSSLTYTSGLLSLTGPALTNDVFVASGTMSTAVDDEVRNFFMDSTITNPSTNTLSAALWVKMHLNETSASTGTFHSGGVFGEVFTSTAAQEFTYGVEGHNVNSSTQSTSYGVGVIGHDDWAGASTSSPTAHQIGVISRAEITLSDRNTARTGPFSVDVIGFRDEEYGNSQRRLYHAQGLANWANVAYLGQALFVSTYTQTIAGGDTIVSDACGSVKHISASGAVTTSTSNTFSAPSSATDGTANKDCQMDVVNESAFTITLDANSNFVTPGGLDVSLPSGANIHVFRAASAWTAGQITLTTGSDVKVSSYPAVANAGTSGQYANQGQITILPGDWDVDAVCELAANGATVTDATMAISINSGNTTTDQQQGNNQVPMQLPIVGHNGGGSIAGYQLAVAASTTVYVKVQAAYSVATPLKLCRISARRIR